MEVRNKYVSIRNNIEGAPQESDFEVNTEMVSLSVEPGSKDVIVKNLYVSIDPYQLNRMKSQSSSQNAINFAVAITPGEVPARFRDLLECGWDVTNFFQFNHTSQYLS